MIEIDCRKCRNRCPTGAGCQVYGIEPKKALAACRMDLFVNYLPKSDKPAGPKPGATVWVIERDTENTALEVVGYVFLARVEGMVICSPQINDDDLDGILAYHAEMTADEEDTRLAVFPAEDCYVKKTDAVADFIKETGC